MTGATSKEADRPPQRSTSSTAQSASVSSNSSKLGNGTHEHSHHKILSRRSSRPILHWLQRKLGSSSKFRRINEGNGTAQISSPPKPRTISVPSTISAAQTRPTSGSATRRKTISLNEDNEDHHSSRPVTRTDDANTDDGSSLARESTWAPTTASADEDASMRPLPPSSPPSPSPSRSSSSYLSDPKTFKSIAASTKPTTVLSIDINAGGMAHIAQAPAVTPSLLHAPHNRNASNATGGAPGSINFSTLPPSTPASLAPSNAELVQAPQHTTHHPRNNPRPSSPPLDNASTFTLASSAYAIPGLRQTSHIHHTSQSGPPSAIGGGDSVSLSQAGSTYADAESGNYPTGDDDRDVDASVRALRPRSSRRGSWESEVSRWSARPGAGTPISRSMWTGASIKTGGGFSADGGPNDDDNASHSSHEATVEDGVIVTLAEKADTEEHQSTPKDTNDDKPSLHLPVDDQEKPLDVIPEISPPPQMEPGSRLELPTPEQGLEQAKVPAMPPQLSLSNTSSTQVGGHVPSPTGTEFSEGGDVWHSAPSTPAPGQAPMLHS